MTAILDPYAALTGTPVFASPYVKPGQIVQTDDGVYFHSHLSARGRKRRKHGRSRPAKRTWKVKYVRYQPELDKLLKDTGKYI